MANRDRDSYIFRRGVSPNTLSVISSKNRIFAVSADSNMVQIGVIATFDPSEARTIEPIRGIGFGDHIAELVPGVTDPMSISVARSALYTSNIFQVFGFKSGIDGIVRSLRHHRWPFDIRQEVIFSKLANRTNLQNNKAPSTTVLDTGDNEGVTTALLTIYEGCWISDYGVGYASDAAIVQETVTINVTDIVSGTDWQKYGSAGVDVFDNLHSSTTESTLVADKNI